jgi:hypothetical protein
MNKACKAACAVAALLHFATIGIENAITKLGRRDGRPLNQQQLVTANTKMPVRNQAYLLRAQLNVLVNGVDNDEVIAKTVHFGKFDLHEADFTAKAPGTQSIFNVKLWF